jgi:hypothetical protein
MIAAYELVQNWMLFCQMANINSSGGYNFHQDIYKLVSQEIIGLTLDVFD